MPTLVIGARYDTMDPAHMETMAGRLPHGRYLYCPSGSHLAMYDDQETYVKGLIVFLEPEFMTSVAAERFQGKNDMHDASAAALILQSFLDKQNISL